MWACWKALLLTLSDVMINCNCFNDWDYSLLVLNKVSDSYFALWIDYYLSIRDHMTISIYVAVMRIIMMPSCPYFILSTPLPLNMWTYLSLSAFAWGQARSKLFTNNNLFTMSSMIQKLHWELTNYNLSHWSNCNLS